MSNITDEALLTQLGFNPNDGILADLKRVSRATSGFEEIKRHLVSLQEKIKHYGAYIGISSSSNYIKIKNATANNDILSEIEHWADKYKVRLIRSSNNYYIAGKES
jgi:hypothetical protein